MSTNFSKSYHPRRTPNIDDFFSSGRLSSGASGTSSLRGQASYQRYGTTTVSSTNNIGPDKKDYTKKTLKSEPINPETLRNGKPEESPQTDRLTSTETFLPDESNLYGKQRVTTSLRAALDQNNTENSTPEHADFDNTHESSEIDKLLSLLKELRHINIDNTEMILKRLISSPKASTELHRLEEENRQLKEAVKSLESKCEEAGVKNEQLVSDAKRLIKDAKRKVMEEQKDTIQKLRHRVTELEDDKKQITTQKETALSRLSKEMGEKLCDNNPGIADLSDPNRSTKIAEKYLNLYDNDWTDALESLTHNKVEEEAGVRFLLEIIKHIYSFCTTAKTELMMDLEGRLTNPISKSQMLDHQNESIEDKQTRQLLENCIKLKAATQIANLQKSYKSISSSKKPTFADRLPEYVNKCVEICWMMNLQNPPLVFAEPPKAGEPINMDMYKQYTRQGDIVSYIVWLPLLVEKDGAVLQKGVVQPVSQGVKSRGQAKKAWVSEKDKSSYRRESDEEKFKRLHNEIHDTPEENSYNKSNHYTHSYTKPGSERVKDKKELEYLKQRQALYSTTNPQTTANDHNVEDLFQNSKTLGYPQDTSSQEIRYTPDPYSNFYPKSEPSYLSTHSSTTHHGTSRYHNDNRAHGRTISSEREPLNDHRTETSKYASNLYGSSSSTSREVDTIGLRHIDTAHADIFPVGLKKFALYNKQLYEYENKYGMWRIASGFPGESDA